MQSKTFVWLTFRGFAVRDAGPEFHTAPFIELYNSGQQSLRGGWRSTTKQQEWRWLLRRTWTDRWKKEKSITVWAELEHQGTEASEASRGWSWWAKRCWAGENGHTAQRAEKTVAEQVTVIQSCLGHLRPFSRDNDTVCFPQLHWITLHTHTHTPHVCMPPLGGPAAAGHTAPKDSHLHHLQPHLVFHFCRNH